MTEAACLCLPTASEVSLSMVTVAPRRQTNDPATYREQERQRIRQVSGRGAISGLKGGLFLLQQHHLDGLGVVGCHEARKIDA